MVRQDIKTDDTGRVLIVNNDLVYGDSDEQHIQDTINAAPGGWKEHFTDGVYIRGYVKSTGQEQFLSRKIKVNLEADLYTVGVPSVFTDPGGQMKIRPNATI